MRIELTLNGAAAAWEIEPGERLLDALRRVGCVSVKRGCETGDCGCCAVLLDGEPVSSCVVAAARAQGRAVTTLEGLAGDPLLARLQAAFLAAGAVQCGYCAPGMLIVSWALLRAGGPLDESAVRHALSGSLCRCTGYEKPVRAILAAAGRPAATLHGGRGERGGTGRGGAPVRREEKR
ncbi:MAG: (2Fe-2S)-binding protein [Candidatus Krumholzibacteriia bacterium]